MDWDLFYELCEAYGVAFEDGYMTEVDIEFFMICWLMIFICSRRINMYKENDYLNVISAIDGKLTQLDLSFFATSRDLSLSDVYDELNKLLNTSYSCELVDNFLEFAKEYDKQFSTESLERELKSCKNPLRKQQIQREIQNLKRRGVK